jgi:hypothetical protein
MNDEINKNSTYTGELNEKGERHGVGKLVYIDGSYYAGEWRDGVRTG